MFITGKRFLSLLENIYKELKSGNNMLRTNCEGRPDVDYRGLNEFIEEEIRIPVSRLVNKNFKYCKNQLIIKALNMDLRNVPSVDELRYHTAKIIEHNQDSLITFLSWDLCAEPKDKKQKKIKGFIAAMVGEHLD